MAAARVLLEAKLPENSAAEAYQAMFSAARAALSERDREARTHHGTWTLFDQLFVRHDLFEGRLRDAARNAEELRYDSDYRVGGASQEGGEARLSRRGRVRRRGPGDVLLSPPCGALGGVEADQATFGRGAGLRSDGRRLDKN